MQPLVYRSYSGPLPLCFLLSCGVSFFTAMSLSTTAPSASSAQTTIHINVSSVASGVENTSGPDKLDYGMLAAWERDLLERQRILDERERELERRINASGGRQQSLPLPRMLKCDTCTNVCSRGTWCIDSYGRSFHRHHHCKVCHAQWKCTGVKGNGKGPQVFTG